MMGDNKQIGETPSSEVANQFRSCRDLSDIVPLYPPRGLYLKPLAKVNVSVNLPQLKTPGKAISTWEVMEKIRKLVLPDGFASLKVAKSTLEFIRLEGDLQDRCRLPRVLARLDSQRLNLAGFPNVLKVRAAEAKDDFPTRHSWDSYFRDAKHMNELKAGERPDTIYITGLPVKWFNENDVSTPSESLITKIFEKWGTLRRVDVPASDPYRPRMRLVNNIHKFSYEDGIFFDAYVQYVEYMDFVRAMDALRGMKLLKIDGQNSLTATIKVDFDKTMHMSDSSVSQREFQRIRLIMLDNTAAEKLRKKEEAGKKQREKQKKKEEADLMAKAERRKNREEKRKKKALTMFRKQEEDKVSMKIAREEQKLIKAQRQLEGMRLLDELFDRIKMKVEKKEIKLGQITNMETKKDEKKNDQINDNINKLVPEDDKKNKKEELKKKQAKKEKRKTKKRRKTQKKRRKGDGSESGSMTEYSDKETGKKKLKSVLTKNDTSSATSTSAVVPSTTLPYTNAYTDPMQMLEIPMSMRYPPISSGMQLLRIPMLRYPSVSSGMQLLRIPMLRYPSLMRSHYHSSTGRGRGYFSGCDTNSYALTNPYLYNEQYYEYFTHLVNKDKERQDTRAHGRRKSMSRSPSRRRKSRSRTRSKTKSRSVSRSCSKRRSGSRSNNDKRSNTRSKSRSRSRSHRSRSRRKTRSKSRSKSRDRRKSASRSVSRTRTRSDSKTKSKNAARSHSRKRSRSRSRRRGSKSNSISRTRCSRSRRQSRSRSRSRSRGNFRNRYRRRYGRRSTSIVRITRAKSRTISPKRRSRSSSWSMPKSPDRRSCSWSRTVPSTNISEDVEKVSNTVTQEKTEEIQKEVAAN